MEIHPIEFDVVYFSQLLSQPDCLEVIQDYVSNLSSAANSLIASGFNFITLISLEVRETRGGLHIPKITFF